MFTIHQFLVVVMEKWGHRKNSRFLPQNWHCQQPKIISFSLPPSSLPSKNTNVRTKPLSSLMGWWHFGYLVISLHSIVIDDNDNIWISSDTTATKIWFNLIYFHAPTIVLGGMHCHQQNQLVVVLDEVQVNVGSIIVAIFLSLAEAETNFMLVLW